MNKSRFLLFCCATFLFSCKNKSDADKIYFEYIDFTTSKTSNVSPHLDSLKLTKNSWAYFQNRPNSGLVKIESTLQGVHYGHIFQFEKGGKLKSYYYLIGDSLHHSLELKKQPSDKFVEKGTPFVDYMENESDSVLSKYSLIFSVFPRSVLLVQYSIDGKKYQSGNLYDSKILPLLKEADVFIDKKINKLYLKIETSSPFIDLNGLADSRSFMDTVLLK